MFSLGDPGHLKSWIPNQVALDCLYPTHLAEAKLSLVDDLSIQDENYSYKSSAWHKVKDNQIHEEKYKHHKNTNITTEKQQRKKIDKNSPTKISDVKITRHTLRQLSPMFKEIRCNLGNCY